MMPSSPGQDNISFSKVAFKGGFRIVFILLIVMVLVSVLAASYLAIIAPKSTSGQSEYTDADLVVTGATEQPVKFTVSHDYPIEVQSRGYYITDGVDLITYNITVRSKGGEIVYQKDSSILMPPFISTYSSDTEYTISEDSSAELPPATYTVNIKASHPIDYSITQKYKYEGAMTGAAVLAVLAVILLIGASISALRRRDALRAQSRSAIYSTQTSGYGIVTEPGLQPDYMPASQQMYGQAGAYQPPLQEPVDYVCARCGNLIQNPVMQGVVTCEKCGERECVGQHQY